LESFKKECDILNSNLTGQDLAAFIHKPYQVVEESWGFYSTLEKLVDYKSLEDVILNQGFSSPIEYLLRFKICLSVLKAVDEIHSKGLYHNNLGLRNIFVKLPINAEKPEIKISCWHNFTNQKLRPLLDFNGVHKTNAILESFSNGQFAPPNTCKGTRQKVLDNSRITLHACSRFDVCAMV
jgi:serine/threonine protein kinase